MDARLWNAVDRRLRKSDINGAIKGLEGRLAKEKVRRFKGLVGRRFTNSPDSVLSFINKFIMKCEEHFKLKAVYLEMNGFDINPDRWFFDPFGYTRYKTSPDDLDWLSDWQSADWPDFTLTGLEEVQRDFKWYHEKTKWREKKFEKAYDLAVLLVMTKFVSLIQSAVTTGPLAKRVPVLATAHDFDIIGRFEPPRERVKRKQAVKG